MRKDDAAFTQLYERYAPAIYRYLYARVQDATLAEDLRAEVFARMVEGLPRYQDRGWPISAWLYRIAHDRSVDCYRRYTDSSNHGGHTCVHYSSHIEHTTNPAFEVRGVRIIRARQ